MRGGAGGNLRGSWIRQRKIKRFLGFSGRGRSWEGVAGRNEDEIEVNCKTRVSEEENALGRGTCRVDGGGRKEGECDDVKAKGRGFRRGSLGGWYG
jgi:hypothetical protein